MHRVPGWRSVGGLAVVLLVASGGGACGGGGGGGGGGSPAPTTGEVRVDLAEALRMARTLDLPESPLTLRIATEGDAPVRVKEIALER